LPLFVVGSTLPPPGAASVSDTHISQSGGPGGLVSEVLEFTRRSHVCGTLAEMHVGERESICGWVASQRSHGSVTFVNAMRDHTGIVQVTTDPINFADTHKTAERLCIECVVAVEGLCTFIQKRLSMHEWPLDWLRLLQRALRC
jgi:aspartyl-tRNA synthetase